jgi:hypothetical protein
MIIIVLKIIASVEFSIRYSMSHIIIMCNSIISSYKLTEDFLEGEEHIG